MNTHYAVIVFSGDPGSEHPVEELRGAPPSLDFIACGPEEFCWKALSDWTAKHPLRMWEDVEVLCRDPKRVHDGLRLAEASRVACGGATNDARDEARRLTHDPVTAARNTAIVRALANGSLDWLLDDLLPAHGLPDQADRLLGGGAGAGAAEGCPAPAIDLNARRKEAS